MSCVTAHIDGVAISPPDTSASFHPFDPTTDVVPLGPLGGACHAAVLCVTALLLLPLRLLLLIACALLAVGFASLAGDRTEQRGAPQWLATVNQVLGRLCLLALGVWPGLLTVRGKQEAAPVLIVAPHVGALDAFFFLARGMPRPVALAPYARLPALGSLFRAAGGIAVPLPAAPAGTTPQRGGSKVSPAPGETGGAEDATTGVPKAHAAPSLTHSVREAIVEHKRRFRPGDRPVAILPEGSTHNGRGLLTFFSGGFEGGGAVQPVTLRYPFSRRNSAAFLTTLPDHARARVETLTRSGASAVHSPRKALQCKALQCKALQSVPPRASASLGQSPMGGRWPCFHRSRAKAAL